MLREKRTLRDCRSFGVLGLTGGLTDRRAAVRETHNIKENLENYKVLRWEWCVQFTGIEGAYWYELQNPPNI